MASPATVGGGWGEQQGGGLLFGTASSASVMADDLPAFVLPHTVGLISQTCPPWVHNPNLTEKLYGIDLYIESQSNQAIILHISRQLSCRDMCKIMAWLDH